MRKKAIISIVLSAFLVTGSVVPCFGGTTREKISDAKARQQANQSSLQATQEKLKELESKKGESESYLQELNTQLQELKISLEQLQRDYDAKQDELTELQGQLEQAKADEQEQYEAMKIRIQYMYENSATNYANLFFQSESIAEFLNQAEHISRMTEYDRDMLKVYKETKETIETKEQEVAREKDEIAAVQQQSAERQEAVEELVAATYHQIREYQEDIRNQESAESRLLSQISEQEDAINSLLRQAKEEEAAKRLAAQKAAEEKTAAEREAEKNKKPQAPVKKPDQGTEQGGSSKPSAPVDKPEDDNSSIDTSKGKYLGKFKLTAYCTCRICCGKWSGGNTASGTVPTPGRTVAMAGVPFGTKLSINGHIYTVEDRGTAYGHVDVLMGSHSEALRFGLKYADVYQVE